ncbi:MAG: transposase, partial [Candidatus Stygibacter frigidus]|nr:transposase [Candidatus Stygibacter frigidus]
VTETSHPDNDVNLIVDIGNSPNNVDDSVILNERLPEIKKMLYDIVELHFDGGYGSTDNDNLMREMGIMPVQTAVRGIKANVEMYIEINDKNEIIVTCPHGQSVVAGIVRKRYRATFNYEICKKCPLFKKCNVASPKNLGKYNFSEEELYRKLRHHNILKLPLERRKLRANVEATMKEFTHRLNGHKLKVRGAFKSSLFTFATAIAINFGRIYRSNMKKDDNRKLLALFAHILKKWNYSFHIVVSKSRIYFQYC